MYLNVFVCMCAQQNLLCYEYSVYVLERMYQVCLYGYTTSNYTLSSTHPRLEDANTLRLPTANRSDVCAWGVCS